MSECRKCGAEIHWHKSKSGKSYPTDSATDRTAFHKCDGAASSAQPEAQGSPQRLEATLAERVTALESTVAELVKQVRQLGARLPIADEDIPF